MKRMILLAALFASSAVAIAQAPDTLHVKKVEDVTVITSQNEQTIILKGSAEDADFNYRSSVRITPESSISISENHFDLFNLDVLKPVEKRAEQHSGPRVFQVEALEYLGLGVSMTHDVAEGLDFTSRPFSELFVSLVNLDIRPGLGPVVLSTGIDLGYHSYRLGSDMFSKPEKDLLVVPVPDEWSLKKSVLRSRGRSVSNSVPSAAWLSSEVPNWALISAAGSRTNIPWTGDGSRRKIRISPWSPGLGGSWPASPSMAGTCISVTAPAM